MLYKKMNIVTILLSFTTKNRFLIHLRNLSCWKSCRWIGIKPELHSEFHEGTCDTAFHNGDAIILSGRGTLALITV